MRSALSTAFAIMLALAGGCLPSRMAPTDLVRLLCGDTRVSLDPASGYALDGIIHRGVEFPCGRPGGFPVFTFIRGTERVEAPARDPDLAAELTGTGKGRASVTYDYHGSRITTRSCRRACPWIFGSWKRATASSFALAPQAAWS